MNTEYTGIDPGSRNLGYACLIIDEHGKVMIYDVEHIDPQELGFSKTINFLRQMGNMTEAVIIERYVAYKGIHNAASEEILMLIGGIRLTFEEYPVSLVRAIEWKPAICKYLVKNKDFSNPSQSLDKKFSMAAAKCIVGKIDGFEDQLIKTDHVADAICLAYYGYIKDDTRIPVQPV